MGVLGQWGRRKLVEAEPIELWTTADVARYTVSRHQPDGGAQSRAVWPAETTLCRPGGRAASEPVGQPPAVELAHEEAKCTTRGKTQTWS